MDNFYTEWNLCFLKHHSYIPISNPKTELKKRVKNILVVVLLEWMIVISFDQFLYLKRIFPLLGQTTTFLRVGSRWYSSFLSLYYIKESMFLTIPMKSYSSFVLLLNKMSWSQKCNIPKKGDKLMNQYGDANYYSWH